MKYQAILFDMDGTLVPMDMDAFTHGYFHFLAEKLSPFHIEEKVLVASIWKGTAAMVANDGTKTNEAVFWNVFEKLTGQPKEAINAYCLDFYSHEFNKAQMFTQPNPLAKKAVELAHEKAEKVVLATNPLFPMCGQITRMGWVGLKPEDFALVTAYETDHFCKPNPNYYLSVCERVGLDPKRCLMIGNDEYEDMYTAASLGFDCYLITDTAIRDEKHPWNGPSGSMSDLIQFLENLE